MTAVEKIEGTIVSTDGVEIGFRLWLNGNVVTWDQFGEVSLTDHGQSELLEALSAAATEFFATE